MIVYSTYSTDNMLQGALFKAAKVGNINLMKELIIAGADPFMVDEAGRNAIFYAIICKSR